MPSNGVSKTSDSKSGNISKFKSIEEKANEGALSRQKLESGMQQAMVSDAHLNESTKPYSDENHPEQTQQNASVDDNPTPQCDKAIPSIEGDIEMQDLGGNRKTEDQRQPTQNGTLDVQSDTNRPNLRSSREQSTGSLAKGLRCLAILDPPTKKEKGRLTQSQSPDPDEIVDGWGTLKKSTFVIVQEGPKDYARFTFKWRPGYTDDNTANISDSYLRVTDIRDRVNGKWVYRYGRENVACFSGAAIEDNVAGNSTRSPCSWLRVEWQGLSHDDMELCNITRGYSWIPKSNLARFCPGRGGEGEKVKEVWDNQERDYVAWARGQPASENRPRSTTPCPLNNSVNRFRGLRATSRLRTPDIRIYSPADDDNGTPPPSRRNDVAGTKSNPVSLVEDTESINSSASSGLPTTTTSNGMNNRDTSGSQGQLPIVEISRAKFMKEKGSEEWKDMDPSERQKQEVIAHALYDIYKATMLQNNGIVVKDLDMLDDKEEEL